MKHVKVKHGLKGKIIRIMLIFSIIQIIVAISVSVRVFSVINLKQNEKLSGEIAAATFSMIDKNDLITLRNQIVQKYLKLHGENLVPPQNSSPERFTEFCKYFDSEAQSEEYKKICNVLYNIKNSYDVADLYIFYVDTDIKNIIYIADGIKDNPAAVIPGDMDYISDSTLNKYIKNHYRNDTYINYIKGYGLSSVSGETLFDDEGEPLCTIAVDVPINKVVKECGIFALEMFAIMFLMQIPIALFMIRHVNKVVVNPINQLNEAVSALVEEKEENVGTSKISRLSLHSGDEIEQLSIAMKKMELDINSYMKKITDITMEKEHMQAELDIAAKIQSEALPHRFPPFPDRREIDIFASMEPAKEVGGDFYDFFMIDDNHLAMVIGDVSGKGIPGALFMMAAMTVIRNYSEACFSPKNILDRANKQLCENNDTHMFVTVWMGILTLSNGELVYANAGHEYPAYKRSEGKYELIKEEHDFVLGGRKKTAYTEFRRKMEPGDVLFVYTDGVPEANDKNEKMYGTDRMLQVLNKNVDLDMNSTLKEIGNDIAVFTDGAPRFDDLTMMGIMYNGSISI